jgi:hypothetical protein
MKPLDYIQKALLYIVSENYRIVIKSIVFSLDSEDYKEMFPAWLELDNLRLSSLGLSCNGIKTGFFKSYTQVLEKRLDQKELT